MSWPTVECGEVVKFIGGSQPAKSSFIYEEKDGYVRLLQIRDYKSDKNLTYIPESSTKKFCTKNDVMIGRYGPPVFQILRGLEGAYNVALMKAEPTEKVDRNYLYYFLKQDTLFRLIDGLSQRTAGQSGVDMGALKKYPMLLPPLAEQQKIAAILDAADSLRQKDQRLIEHYTALSQSLFLEMFGDPVGNPMGWKLHPFSDCLLDIVGGKSVGGEERELRKNEKAVIKISAVTSGVFRSDQFKVVHPNDLPEVLIHPRANDLLFSRANTREMVGATCVVNRSYYSLFLPDKIWRLDLHTKKASNWYIKFLLTHEGFRENLRKVATGTSGSMLNISKAKLKQLKVPLPPIDLQNQFTQRIEAIEQQKQQTQANLEKSETLFNSLLQRAFKGELTHWHHPNKATDLSK